MASGPTRPLLASLRFVLVGAIIAFYAWTAIPTWNGSVVGRGAGGNYTDLTRSMLKRHLYLDTPADPFLATLSNPGDPAQSQGHGLPEASYYHGRYYLYFGVSPVILLLLPFRILTGLFMGDSLACTIFCAVGFLASAWLILALRKRYFPAASEVLTLATLLALGLANTIPILLRRPSLYEVPISCAYACTALGLVCLYQSLHCRKNLIWIALSGTCLALAVGSRPSFILICPLVLLPVWLKWRETRSAGEAGFSAIAAALPAAVIGAGLALYNFLRFGNPFEFGFRYQLQDTAKIVHFSGRYFATNLHNYILTPAYWGHFFPFVSLERLAPQPYGYYGAEDPYGLLPNMPFVILILGGVVLWRSPRVAPLSLRIFAFAVASAAAVLTVLMLSYQSAINRYMVDFTPWLVLGACIGAYALVETDPFERRSKRVIIGFVIALAVFSSAFNVFASFRHNELLHLNEPKAYAKVARPFDRIPQAIDSLTGTHYGPIEMTVLFPEGKIPTEPLLTSGISFLTDFVLVFYTNEKSIQLGFTHTNYETFFSAPVTIDRTKPHTVTISMGSCYPPKESPYFDRYSPEDAQRLQSMVRIALDGRVILYRWAPTYDAVSSSPVIGLSIDGAGYKNTFSGRILAIKRLKPPAEPVSEESIRTTHAKTGPLVLQLQLPKFTVPHREPLLCSGNAGAGDLLYLKFESPTRLSVGYDHWSKGGPVSQSVTYDPDQVQTIEIDSGSLHPNPASDPTTALTGHLLVRMNGDILFDEAQPYYPSDPASVQIGQNPIGASTAEASYTGQVIESHFTGNGLGTPAH